MMKPAKRLVFIGPREGSAERLLAWARTGGAALASRPDIHGCVLDIAIRPGSYAGCLQLWTDAEGAELGLGAGWDIETYAVEPRVEKLTRPHEAAGPVAGLVQIVAWTRHAELTDEDAFARWDEHVPLALRIHVGAANYVRHRVLPNDTGRPVSGVAMLTYPTLDDYRDRRYAQPGDDALIAADVARFLGAFQLLVAEEHVLKLPPSRG